MIKGGCNIKFFSLQQMSSKCLAHTLSKKIDMSLTVAKLSEIE